MLRTTPSRLLAALCALTAAATAQTTHIVEQQGFDWVPKDIAIALGDTVEWRRTSGNHSVTEGTDGTIDGNEAFHSPLNAGTPIFSVTFDAALLLANPRPGDVYDYFCEPHFFLAQVGTVAVKSSALAGSPPAISLATGGTQTLALDAGAALAGHVHFVVGSASGTSPGFPIDGLELPLVIDTFTLFTVSNANSAALVGTLGVLDAAGQATASIVVPPGLSAGLAGLTLNHAYLAIDVAGAGNAVLASNAVPLALVP